MGAIYKCWILKYLTDVLTQFHRSQWNALRFTALKHRAADSKIRRVAVSCTCLDKFISSWAQQTPPTAHLLFLQALTN